MATELNGLETTANEYIKRKVFASGQELFIALTKDGYEIGHFDTYDEALNKVNLHEVVSSKQSGVAINE